MNMKLLATSSDVLRPLSNDPTQPDAIDIRVAGQLVNRPVDIQIGAESVGSGRVASSTIVHAAIRLRLISVGSGRWTPAFTCWACTLMD
jgi:hypothetical protein